MFRAQTLCVRACVCVREIRCYICNSRPLECLMYGVSWAYKEKRFFNCFCTITSSRQQTHQACHLIQQKLRPLILPKMQVLTPTMSFSAGHLCRSTSRSKPDNRKSRGGAENGGNKITKGTLYKPTWLNVLKRATLFLLKPAHGLRVKHQMKTMS